MSRNSKDIQLTVLSDSHSNVILIVINATQHHAIAPCCDQVNESQTQLSLRAIPFDNMGGGA